MGKLLTVFAENCEMFLELLCAGLAILRIKKSMMRTKISEIINKVRNEYSFFFAFFFLNLFFL